MLDLSFNNISEIPAAINSLKSLTHLNLQNNNIKFVPDYLRNLDSLKVTVI